ncbi:hypothetical protein M422DRAFT_70246 [Sphaerobolus stellatus SS14]|uniref:Uncharacterized protein n=1 Tax=Sphaerobolus stellatus (strain SS14) TaxID=990650 RepID=A0A0C9UYE0_SPHS4|nr:hypothetical protein M422DRAFT_70246 [Sphaerobolus stellatus SS14]
MKPEIVAKWLEQSAYAPPPPTTPSALPIADDTVSTVYPESSVSNPYASRYTGMKHRSPAPVSRGTYPPPAYRPNSAQGHYRERERLHPISSPPPPPAPPRLRSRSLSAETYMPAEPKPMSYGYTPPPKPPSPTKGVPPIYYPPVTPAVPHHSSRSPSRGVSRSPAPTTGYRVASPQRVEPPRKSSNQYVTYTTYHSTPALSSTPQSVTKKPHLLQRLFGLDWGSAQKREAPRSSSRSSSKTKSHSHSRSSDHSSGTRPSRGRTHSDGNVLYVRY